MSFIRVTIIFLKNLINNGHVRSVNAKKNILVSLFLKGGSIAISVLMVPLTIHYINSTQYGIWLTLSSIIGWFGFFDIGFGNGLRNKFAEAVANGQYKLARIYVSTTYAILIIVICFVLTLFFCINPYLAWSKILNAPYSMEGELRILALIVFVFFCLQFIFQLLIIIITADQQPAKASVLNFIGSLVSIIIIFILTKTTSGNLIYLGVAFGLSPVIVLIASSIWCYTNEYQKYAPSLMFVRFRIGRELMSLGIKFFVIQIAFVILYQTDVIVIAQLYGPQEVAPYNIAYKFFNVIPMIYSIVVAPFWSAFTEAFIKTDITWIKASIKKLVGIWTLLTIVTLIMLISSNVIYSYWVGDAIKVPILLSTTIALNVIINAWCMIYSMFLNGVGRLKLQLNSALFGALINIPLSILLGKLMGISGVVFATCLLSIFGAILSPLQYNKIINNKATGVWNK